MRRRRAWYFVLLPVLGLAAAIYGLISRQVFWVFVGLAWLFLSVTQYVMTRRR